MQPPRWQTVRSSLPPFIPQKKEPPGPNTQELSQNQTTSSPPPQLSQLPLQPIRTRLLPQRIHPLFTPTLFNPLADSLINPHLLNLKTLHIRHRNLSASNISSTSPQLPQFPLQPIRSRLLPQRIRPLFTPTLFNSLTDPLFDSLINPHLLNLKTLHIRHRNLSIIFNNPDHLQQLPQNIIYRIHLPGIRY